MTNDLTATQPVLPPKVFISYSWTSNEHAAWVLSLATRLVKTGVETILDRWHLKTGQDKYKFMEQMVSDPTVTKVLMVCDRQYAEKANGRKGGVGDETQIVSSEIYGKTDQTKFLPLIADPARDEDGNPYKPQYLKARIHIDLSNPLTYEQGFEDLLRDILGNPVNTPPPLGKLPSFLLDDTEKPLPTAYMLNMFRNALLSSKPTVRGLADDYLNKLLQELEQFNLKHWEQPGSSWEENIRKCLEVALPYRDDYIEFLLLLTQYGTDPRLFTALHRFFSKAIRFIFSSVNNASYDSEQDTYEPYRFLIPELFLYTIAALLKNDHYEATADMLSRPYYDGEAMQLNSRNFPASYGLFQPYLEALERPGKNHPLRLNIPSPTAKLLMQRATCSDLSKLDIIDADYVLYIRHLLNPEDDNRFSWSKTLGSYINNISLPFFVHAQSKSVFAQAKAVINVQNKADLLQKFERAVAYSQDLHGRSPLVIERDRMQIDALDML